MHSLKLNFTRIAFACLLLTVGFASTASAVTSRFQILLNLDNQTNTGCDVPTLTGTFNGVERILITTVDTTGSSASVTAVETQTCVNQATDTFGPATPIITPPGRPLPWTVGVSNGTGGTSVIETFFPLAGVPMGPSANIRLGVLGFNSGGTLVDEMVTRQSGPGNGPPILMQIQGVVIGEIPTLSEWGLMLLALLLAGMAVALMKRRTRAAFLVAFLLLGGAGLAWAAACDLDGTTTGEWNSSLLLAEEPVSDAPAGADIRALYGCRDTGLNGLCFRIDALLLYNQPPVANDDAATVTEDAPATAVPVLTNDTDSDGDPFTIQSVTQPLNGTVVITGGGTGLTYQPNLNYCNTPPGTTLDTFTYTLTPGGDSATVSMTVTCVNDNPIANDDTATVLEDSGATAVPVLANDTDPENDPFTIQSVTQPANGTVVITGGGTGLTYQPNPNYCNTPPGTTLDTFTYTLTPGGDSATVSMSVTCGDDPPVAVADAATVAEDSGATAVPVLANDTDVDGGPISIASVTQPTNGTVVITGGGTGLTYQPNLDYCNAPPGTTLDTFTYTLTPGVSTATVTMTVTCVDDSPVAVDDAATVAEDSGATAVPVLANDTDVDGGPISITSVTQPANGTVVITGGGTGLTYQPNLNYCNTPPGTALDTFTYTLTPGGDSATVSMSVTCDDDPPVAVADAATVAEDSGATAVPVLANDTDVDGGPISITSVTQPANGTVVITGGGTGLTYQPNPGYCNTPPGTTLDTFTYTLTPGGSSATVTMSVTCDDDPPVAVADAATVAEDSGATAIPVLANDTDTDGGPISIAAVTQPANGTVVITGGGTGLTYQPNPNYCNTPPGTTLDTFTYMLAPGVSTATVSVSVTCLNDAPALDLDADDSQGTPGSDFAVTFTEGNAATLIEDPTDATVTDVDNTTLATLTVTLTNLFDTGNEVLSTDVTGTSITATYVTVPGTPGTGTLTLTGPDTVANFQTVLRKVRYLNTDNAPDTTPRVIQFVANDGTTNSNTATATVTMVSVDTNPTAVADSATVNEDSGATAVPVLANDTDPDGGPISIQSVTQPTNGTVVITGGGTGLTYQPNPNYCNSVSGVPDTFMYTLTPGGSTATVSMTVTCQDDNPVAVADAATVAEDSGATAIPVLANDTDADGGPISITSVTQPANGAVVITGGGTGLTYQPNPNYCNTPPGTTLDTFTYTLTPGGSTATVTMTVTCVDDNPVAVNDAATVLEDALATAVPVLANDTDVDGGPISITSVTQPTNGVVVITGGGTGLTYQPNPNYCNTPPGTMLDTFTYTLTPGGSTATVAMSVTCIDDPPVAVADAASVNEDSGATAIPVLANDTDPDGGPISITSVTQPTNGTVVITGGGTGLTYQPNPNYCNTPPGTTLDTFTYTLTPASATPTATVTMTVNCINDPPVADNDTFDFIGNTELRVDLAAVATPHALETTGTTFGVLDGDSDPVENDAISVTAIVGCADITAPFVCPIPGVGTVTMESNGRFSFLPEPGDAGATEVFQYTVTDNGVPAPASTTAMVTLTRFERVWYVKNDAPGGGNGTSVSPFNSITAANLSDNDSDGDLTDDLDSAGDYIFVYFGTGTAANQSGGLVLENGQHLIGQHAGLSLNVNLNGNGAPTNLVTAVAGNRPLLDDTVVDAFEGVSARNVIPAEIVGMNLAGNVNGIDWTTTAAFAGTGDFSIRDNVVRSAANEGVDVNLAGTGATRLAFNDNNLTATGSGLDVQETGTGTLTITGFANNVVSGNTGGTGIYISSATFDSTPGTPALDTVSGGTTVIGASGNPVGTNLTHGSLFMETVSGSLAFTDLDIYAAGFGLTVVGTGPFTGVTGMSIQVTSAPPDNTGTSTLVANDGAAVAISNATVDLRLAGLTSTPTTFSTSGVDFTNVAGQFRAPSGSSITKGSGIGQAFGIDNSAAGTTVLTSVYNGTINNSSATARAVRINNADSGSSATFTGAVTETGQGLSLTNNTGATISFSGGLTASTGANAAFTATGGGTISVCDENPCNGGATGGLVNTLTTATGTALNVANTTISANGLEFRSIAANGASNGIILNTTGNLGGLSVKGTGIAGSGGTIQNITNRGASFTSAINIALTNMNFTNANTADGATSDGVVGGTENTDENGAIHLQNVTQVDLIGLSINGAVQHGINGNNVTDLDISNTTIQNTGDEVWESGIYIFDLKGLASASRTNVFDNVNITNDSGQFNIALLNDDGTNDRPAEKDRLEVNNSQFTRNGNNPLISDNVTVLNSGTANFQVVVSGSTFASTVTCGSPAFTGACVSDNIQVDAGNTSAFDAMISTGNNFTNGNAGQSAVNISASGAGQGTFNVSNVVTTVRASQAINVALTTTNAAASLRGTIANNNLSTNVTNNAGTAIQMVLEGSGTMVVDVNNNTINGNGSTDFDYGIRGGSRAGSGVAHFQVNNNNVPSAEVAGVWFFAGNATAGETSQTCANFVSNLIDGDPVDAFTDYFTEMYTGTTFQLQGLAGSGANATNVQNFIAGTDDDPSPTDPTVNANSGTTVNYTNAVCQTP